MFCPVEEEHLMKKDVLPKDLQRTRTRERERRGEEWGGGEREGGKGEGETKRKREIRRKWLMKYGGGQAPRSSG